MSFCARVCALNSARCRLPALSFLFVMNQKSNLPSRFSHTATVPLFQRESETFRATMFVSPQPSVYGRLWRHAGPPIRGKGSHCWREREGAWSVAARLADRRAPPPHGICQIATFLVFVKCKTLALWSEELLNAAQLLWLLIFGGCCCYFCDVSHRSFVGSDSR